jgi:hypothetical protein
MVKIILQIYVYNIVGNKYNTKYQRDTDKKVFLVEAK